MQVDGPKRRVETGWSACLVSGSLTSWVSHLRRLQSSRNPSQHSTVSRLSGACRYGRLQEGLPAEHDLPWRWPARSPSKAVLVHLLSRL
jgi:hypothetical protein